MYNSSICFIHTADIHLYENHKYSIDGSRLKTIYQNLLRMIKFISKKENHKIKMIIIAGDIFHTYNPPENLIKLFSKFINQAVNNGIVIRAITGNHDTNGINFAFESLKYISEMYIDSHDEIPAFKVFNAKNNGETIYTEKISNVNFIYVPYQENIGEVLKVARNKRIKECYNVLVTHCAVDGALTNSDYEMKGTTVTKKILSGYDYVALGDFHTYQQIGNEQIYYSGSISKIVWDERHADKAFNYVECDLMNVRKIKLPDSPFIEIKIDYNDIGEFISKKKHEDVTGAFIKLYIFNQTGYGDKAIELKKYLLNSGAIDVYYKVVKNIGESYALKSIGDEVVINLDTLSICKAFLRKNKIKDVNYSKYLEDLVAKL